MDRVFCARMEFLRPAGRCSGAGRIVYGEADQPHSACAGHRGDDPRGRRSRVGIVDGVDKAAACHMGGTEDDVWGYGSRLMIITAASSNS